MDLLRSFLVVCRRIRSYFLINTQLMNFFCGQKSLTDFILRTFQLDNDNLFRIYSLR